MQIFSASVCQKLFCQTYVKHKKLQYGVSFYHIFSTWVKIINSHTHLTYCTFTIQEFVEVLRVCNISLLINVFFQQFGEELVVQYFIYDRFRKFLLNSQNSLIDVLFLKCSSTNYLQHNWSHHWNHHWDLCTPGINPFSA